MREPIILAFIAGMAGDDQIGWAIGTAPRDRHNMVNMELARKFFMAVITLAFLSRILSADILNRMFTFRFSQTGTAVARVVYNNLLATFLIPALHTPGCLLLMGCKIVGFIGPACRIRLSMMPLCSIVAFL